MWLRLALSALLLTASLPAFGAAVPDQMVVKNVPPVPQSVSDKLEQYQQARSAGFVDWMPKGQGALIATRFGDTAQLHSVAKPGSARQQLTFYKEPLTNGVFSPAGNGDLLFVKDVGGSESYQLFLTNIYSGKTTQLTSGDSRVGRPVWNHTGTHFVYRSTERNQKDYDVYLASVQTPTQKKMIYQGEGFWSPSVWSPDDRRLILYNYVSSSQTQFVELDLKSGKTTALFPQLNLKTGFDYIKYTPDGKGVVYTSDQSSEFKQVHHRDLKTGKMTALSPATWSVTDFNLAPNGQYMAYVLNQDGMSQLYIQHKGRLVSLPQLPVGQIFDLKFDPKSEQLGFSMVTSQQPTDVYSLNLKTRKLTRWTHSEVGGLDTSRFAEAQLVRYPSFDGKKIPAFYFQPRAPKYKKSPVVIYIHGGPASQYRPGYSSLFQYWANELGIAVLAPNVRGSRGYGKAYLALDNGYKREDSVKDIGALLDWIKTQPQLDPERVAVYGGSYGGYMVLASLVHYADRLKAGVDSVGISNFVTFLENTKAYRRDLRRVEYGDERDPQMRAFLQKISPLNQVENIKSPLMVVQGLNDPRVPASEAEQMVKALESRRQEVWYLLAKDEGHGFKKKKNRDYYYEVMALFWQKYLLPGDG